MNYSFPEEYFLKVETRRDFELNHIGTVIKWNDMLRSGEPKLMKQQNIIRSYNEDIIHEIDNEYAQEEVERNNKGYYRVEASLENENIDISYSQNSELENILNEADEEYASEEASK